MSTHELQRAPSREYAHDARRRPDPARLRGGGRRGLLRHSRRRDAAALRRVRAGTTVRHVLARHEQGAGHMAQGYARASGAWRRRIATSGPGATNLVTPIANAGMDSTPLVCVTGQVAHAVIGTNAFQECDIVGVTLPLVKHSWQVRDARAGGRAARGLRARPQRPPGPGAGGRPARRPGGARDAPGAAADAARRRPLARRRRAVAARLIGAADRPVLYVGGGVVNAGARASCARWRSRAHPGRHDADGQGRVPRVSRAVLRLAGDARHELGELALNSADLVIAVGARFDDRVTGRLDAFAGGAKVAHLDIDPYEIGKLRQADCRCSATLRPASRASARSWGARRQRAWIERIAPGAAASAPPTTPPRGALKPQAVMERLDETCATAR